MTVARPAIRAAAMTPTVLIRATTTRVRFPGMATPAVPLPSPGKGGRSGPSPIDLVLSWATIRYDLWLSTRPGADRHLLRPLPTTLRSSAAACRRPARRRGKLVGGGRRANGASSCGRGCRTFSVPAPPMAPGEPPRQWPAGTTFDAAGCGESDSAPHATAWPNCQAHMPRQGLSAQAVRALGSASRAGEADRCRRPRRHLCLA
jgi:hypothetical protein